MTPHPLREWMDAEGKRQEDVAADVGIDQTYISKILRGRRKPSKALASRLSKLTARKVTVEAILSYEAEYEKHRPRGATMPTATAETTPPSAATERERLRLVKAKA